MRPLVILVGGGSGKRMGTHQPKQFLEVKGFPIWYYTVQRFLSWSPDCQFIMVLPELFIPEIKLLTQTFFPSHDFIFCAGGNERVVSVQKGISALADHEVSSWVWIHDMVRPLVSIQTLNNLKQVAENKGNAVAAVPIKASLRMRTEQGSIAVDRNLFMEVQTPQVFKLGELIKAYKHNNQLFTDDASLMESHGHFIHLAEGNYENIKITTPEDLFILENMLNH